MSVGITSECKRDDERAVPCWEMIGYTFERKPFDCRAYCFGSLRDVRLTPTLITCPGLLSCLARAWVIHILVLNQIKSNMKYFQVVITRAALRMYSFVK